MEAKSYWNHEGRYQDLYEQLAAIIPMQGSVLTAENEAKVREDLPEGSPKLGRKGKFYHLEALRLGANQYYDLYNNGLWNRSAGFAKRFGVTKDEATRWNFGDEDAHNKINRVMDLLIINAAVEIGFDVPRDGNADHSATMRISDDHIGTVKLDDVVKSVVRETVEAEEAKLKAAILCPTGKPL